MYNNNNNAIVWYTFYVVISSSPRNNYVVTVANKNIDNDNINCCIRVCTSGNWIVPLKSVQYPKFVFISRVTKICMLTVIKKYYKKVI